MSLSLTIPTALLLLTITSAAPLTPPGLTPDVSPIVSPETPLVLNARASSCAPGGLLALNNWSLQLPTGSAGSVDSIPGSQLSGCNGWQSDKYFYVDGNAVVMKVPGSVSSAGCVTTPNSQHCRTELREQNPDSWDPKSKTNKLSAQLEVTKPDGSKYGTVVGQVKIDNSVSTKPLAELFYAQDGTIRIGVSQIPDVSSLKMTEVGHVAVGERFTYELKYEECKFSVKIGDGAEQVMSTGDVNCPKSYFKAGNYNQGDSPSEVRFYKIDVQH
ncbi:polysaccharide lyase family 7 protein [Phaeosphaeria sp. MPI-PUGE-AT-0046c]|nr:polysaccharide lyase family 7 protein [Phaeosphaeria sp. MPI-PUGE-AT-0046c]